MERRTKIWMIALAVLVATLTVSPSAFGAGDTGDGMPPNGVANAFSSSAKGTKLNGVISVEFRNVVDLVAGGGCVAAMRLRKGGVGPETLVQEIAGPLALDDATEIELTTLAIVTAFKEDILETFFGLDCGVDDCVSPAVTPKRVEEFQSVPFGTSLFVISDVEFAVLD